ncbi:MAG: hypothetical protein KAG94_02630 [Clostridiales bacterium]|nr:hypothetical protein [Clostridiales bacterium]
MKKLLFSKVLSETLSLYKKHFFKLLIIAGMLSLINVLIKVISSFTFDFKSPIVIILVGTIQVVSVILLFYGYLRVFCAMINYTYNLACNNEISYKDSLFYAKRLWTKLLGAGALLIGMVFIPVLVILFADVLFNSIALVWSLKALMVALLIIIITRYSFMIYIRLIEPDSKNFITRTITLLKGNYLVFFLILLIVYSISFAKIIFDYQVIVNNISIGSEIFISVIYNLINVFVFPIVIGAQVVIYRKLVAN